MHNRPLCHLSFAEVLVTYFAAAGVNHKASEAGADRSGLVAAPSLRDHPADAPSPLRSVKPSVEFPPHILSRDAQSATLSSLLRRGFRNILRAQWPKLVKQWMRRLGRPRLKYSNNRCYSPAKMIPSASAVSLISGSITPVELSISALMVSFASAPLGPVE